MKNFRLALALALLATSFCAAQSRRKVIINQDCSGPGGSNMQTLLLLIQSPQVEVLGITVVSGNQWRDEEVAHALRLLEIIGRTDIPVMAGAAVSTGSHPRKRAALAAALRQSRPLQEPGTIAGGTNPLSFLRFLRASPRPSLRTKMQRTF